VWSHHAENAAKDRSAIDHARDQPGIAATRGTISLTAISRRLISASASDVPRRSHIVLLAPPDLVASLSRQCLTISDHRSPIEEKPASLISLCSAVAT